MKINLYREIRESMNIIGICLENNLAYTNYMQGTMNPEDTEKINKIIFEKLKNIVKKYEKKYTQI